MGWGKLGWILLMDGWGYGPAPFHFGIWTGPFLVGDMDCPLSNCRYGLAPFRSGIWNGPVPRGDMDGPLSVGDMDSTGSMPISSIGGMWSVDFWNPKYAAHIFKGSPWPSICWALLYGLLIWLVYAASGDMFTLPMNGGNMFCVMFGRAQKQPLRMPRKMMLGMRLMYALCCQKHTTTACGECNLKYCAEFFALHTCGAKTDY